MKHLNPPLALSISAWVVAASLFGFAPDPANAAPAPASAPLLSGVNYCTAGTSTNGCNATMSCSGAPSVSAASGFVLCTNNLEGMKNALMRYSITGQNNTPWGLGSSSFVCIRPPMQKMGPSLNSGGTLNACDGAICLDFLTWLANHGAALGQPLSAGTTIYVQTIYKDPGAVKNTNLSDGLEFTLTP